MAFIGARQDRARVEVPAAPLPGADRGIYDKRVSKALADIRQGMAQTGFAVVDFGASGASDARVSITDQRGILATSIVRAELALIATADHSIDEHLVEQIHVAAGDILPGSGFTISAISTGSGDGLLRGQWTVQWSWS